uniref:DNA primase large subunit n=1 Tax=Syphacia muris TaxID=451379 RepID=A0A0N5AEK5_9BILA
MQFQTSSRLNRKRILTSVRSAQHWEPDEFNISMYSNPPNGEVSLMDFRELAIRRLKVLKVVENARERFLKNSDSYIDALYKGLSKLMPIACGLCTPDSIADERRWDCISHWILRLAFCRTPEQTKWFLQNEIDLFAFRFQREMKNRNMIEKFLRENKFNVQLLCGEDKDALCHRLSGASEIPVQKARCIQYWKIPFTDALELIRKRKVYLMNGFALVSENDLAVIVCSRFRMMVSASMAHACKYIDFLGEEDRLVPFLKKLGNRCYIGGSYSNNEKDLNHVTPQQIDKLAIESFPLCMRYIHHRLKTDHHLRHGARLQYGLFLKGIGLSLEGALSFFRSEFTKKIDSEKAIFFKTSFLCLFNLYEILENIRFCGDIFDKQYAYNIRYNYGKEGRRVEYLPYSCQKIIFGNAPVVMDCHGCPYKHCDQQLLVQRLEGVGISKDCIDKIVTLSAAARYDRACTTYFEYMHKFADGSLDAVITHPNQYYDLSCQVRNGIKSQ